MSIRHFFESRKDTESVTHIHTEIFYVFTVSSSKAWVETILIWSSGRECQVYFSSAYLPNCFFTTYPFYQTVTNISFSAWHWQRNLQKLNTQIFVTLHNDKNPPFLIETFLLFPSTLILPLCTFQFVKHRMQLPLCTLSHWTNYTVIQSNAVSCSILQTSPRYLKEMHWPT